MTEPADILTRLARSERYLAPVAGEPAPGTPVVDAQAEKKRRRLGRLIRALDVAAAIFWVYAATKVFIADVDRAVVSALAPWALPWLDYRVFLYLGILVVLFVFWRRLWWVLLYIAFFPLLVLVWKIPWFFIKRKSWPLAFAGLQTFFSLLGEFRYHLISKSLWLLAVVLILVGGRSPVVLAAAVLILALMVSSFYRIMRKTFAPSKFITMQRNGIRRVLNSGPFRQFLVLKDQYKQTDVERYGDAAAIEVANTISYGILATRGLYLWAFQLERYRAKYSPSLVFAAVSFAWLLLATVVNLGFVNWAVLQALPEQFRVHSEPSLFGAFVYALSSLAFSDGGGLSAAGDIAFALRLFGGFAGGVFLLAMFLNVVLTMRREQDDSAIRELVSELKQHGRAQATWFANEYAVSVDEAQARLVAIGGGLASILRYVAEAIPAEYGAPDSEVEATK